MKAQIAKWGNSLAVRLPRPIADALGLEAGVTVDLNLKDGAVELVPTPPRRTLAQLLAEMDRLGAPAEPPFEEWPEVGAEIVHDAYAARKE